MVEILLTIVLIAIAFRVLFTKMSNVELLIFTIITFIFVILYLFSENHVLIGTIFLIVYVGAILVFLCISFLVLPEIQDKDSFKVKNLSKWFILLVLVILLVSMFFVYNFDLQNPTNIIEIKNVVATPTLKNEELVIKMIKEGPINFNKIENKVITENFRNEIIEKAYSNKFSSHININQINDHDNNLILSRVYANNGIVVLTVGVYLLSVMLGCLILFLINHIRKLIKRQDSIDQILKRWFGDENVDDSGKK